MYPVADEEEGIQVVGDMAPEMDEVAPEGVQAARGDKRGFAEDNQLILGPTSCVALTQ